MGYYWKKEGLQPKKMEVTQKKEVSLKMDVTQKNGSNPKIRKYLQKMEVTSKMRK